MFKKIKIPDIMTEEFAEFYGIMLGDGCIYSSMKSICISSHSILEKHYSENYVSKLIIKLFDVKPKIYSYYGYANALRCIVHSQRLAEFLVGLGFPKGIKKNKAFIPKFFFKDEKLLKACIRGLNDTDGGVYPQKNVGIILDIHIPSKSLLDSAKKAAKIANVKMNSTHDRLYLCGERDVFNFFMDVGSSNLRNILKFKDFIKTGKAPKSSELIERLLKRKAPRNFKLPYYGPVV